MCACAHGVQPDPTSGMDRSVARARAALMLQRDCRPRDGLYSRMVIIFACKTKKSERRMRRMTNAHEPTFDIWLVTLYFQTKMSRLISLGRLGATKSTRTSRRNETNLGTSRQVTAHSGSVTNVLVVTTTVRVLNRVHSHTTNLRPAVALDLVLVVARTSLKHRLVAATTTRNLTHSRTAARRNGLLGARRKLDTGEARVEVVGDQNAVFTRRLGEGTAVTELGLDVADNGTFRHGVQRQNVTDGQSSLLTGVHELTSVRTFGGDEELLLVAVLLGVTESHLRIVKKRGNHRQSSRSVRFCSCILHTRTSRASGGMRAAPTNPKPYSSPTRTISVEHVSPSSARRAKFVPWRAEHHDPGRG